MMDSVNDRAKSVMDPKAWPKIGLVVAILVTVLCLHYFTPPQFHYQHALYRMFFYIPLILATFWFGREGVFRVTIFIVLFYIPFIVHRWNQFSIHDFSRLIETVLFMFIAFVLGHLVEKERRRHRELLQAGSFAAMGKAVSEVAHDMKTSLVAIGGLAHHLAKHPEKRQNSQEKLDLIAKEATRLEMMVREMLDFGKELELHPAPTNMNQLVQETVNLADTMARDAGVEVRVETDETVNGLSVDGMKIRQLLLNLISNAIQACSPESKVTVTTKRSQDYLLLQVSDEGCGIDVDDRDKIFDPFFTKRKKGTGLGLAIVKRIADAHGADISVENNIPRGTTITISLPA